MGERLHVFLAEAGELPSLDPRPGADISDRVFALAVAGEVIARLAGVLATQLDFQHAVDAEGFVAETFDGVYFLNNRVNMLYLTVGRRRGGRHGECRTG